MSLYLQGNEMILLHLQLTFAEKSKVLFFLNFKLALDFFFNHFCLALGIFDFTLDFRVEYVQTIYEV